MRRIFYIDMFACVTLVIAGVVETSEGDFEEATIGFGLAVFFLMTGLISYLRRRSVR